MICCTVAATGTVKLVRDPGSDAMVKIAPPNDRITATKCQAQKRRTSAL